MAGLDFFYQPPLTQEYQNGYSEEFQKEIAVSETQVKDLEGNVLVERPENVVGSYAVYHQTKGGMNDINGKDYKTGKAFHIFRPKIIDAEGKETWGNLHIENGIYSEEIPQDFLNKAVYPIKSNATFGWGVLGSNFNMVADNILASSETVSPTQNGTLISMSYYGYDSGDLVKIAVYENTVLIDYTGGIALGATADWFSGNVILGAKSVYTTSNYLLAWQPNATVRYYYDLLAAANAYSKTQTYATAFPDPITWSDYAAKYHFSIYATYTPAGGGAVFYGGIPVAQFVNGIFQFVNGLFQFK